MSIFNPNTPQLKATQKLIDAYTTRDISKIGAVFSRDYRHQTLPKSIGPPEEGREEYIKRCGGLLPSFTKFEVRIQRWVTILRLPDSHSPPVGDGPQRG